jgi:hypothetical protein
LKRISNLQGSKCALNPLGAPVSDPAPISRSQKALRKKLARVMRFWSPVTRHRFLQGDLSPSNDEAAHSSLARCAAGASRERAFPRAHPPRLDGDKSPRQSGDQSPHSKFALEDNGDFPDARHGSATTALFAIARRIRAGAETGAPTAAHLELGYWSFP